MKKLFAQLLVFICFITLIIGNGWMVNTVFATGQNSIGTPTQQTTDAKKVDKATPEAHRTANADVKEDSCGFGNVTCWLSRMVGSVLLGLASLLTQLGGVTLNSVAHFTIVDAADNYRKLDAIEKTWGTVRDIANMGFIFVLLYAAIQTILGTGGDNKKLIVNVVIAAILINFSLFFTQLIIDAANLLAITFYSAIAGPGALGTANDFILSRGLSNAYTKVLGFQSLFQSGIVDWKSIITVGILGSVVLLIAAFMFFAMAIMLIIRYAVLILVMILSPIAIVASILPGMSGYGKQWWNALSGQAFFAPIFLFLTWISIQVLTGVKTTLPGTDSSWKQALGDTAGAGGIAAYNSGAINLIVLFGITIVFMIASIVIAKDWADKTGHGISNATKWAFGTAGAASFGMAGRFGRGTIGRAGQAFSENEWLKDKAPTSRLARLGLAASRKTGGTSFDVRGTGIGSTLGAGKAQKGGYAKDLKDKTEAEKKLADSFKPSDILVAQAERALDDAKKNGTPEQLRDAQLQVDKLKGVGEDEARKRAIRQIREDSGWTIDEKAAKKELSKKEAQRLREISTLKATGMTQKQAEDRLEEMRDEEIKFHLDLGRSEDEAKKAAEQRYGWKAETVKSSGNERKEAYAKEKEVSTMFKVGGVSFDPGRVAFIGKVKRENLSAAIAIRKSIKEKKASEKIAEEIEKQARDAADDTDTGTAAGTGAGSTPPTGGPSGTPPTP